MTGMGGDVFITSGYGTNTGGNISLMAGDSGGTAGNVNVTTSEGTWTFKNDGALRFPDNSVQTTAYTGLINFISSETEPGSSVVASETNVNINFSDGGGTWSFGATAVSFPDNTVQTTAYAQKYKVYTALLTQSGTSSTQNISTGNLTVGVTYFINNNIGGDFTNVGAPNNDNGTYFVATDTTPADWGINLSGDTLTFDTGAPVVTVLENTIGNIWFSYDNDGDYLATSDGLFTTGKTFLICTGLVPPTGDPITTLQFSRINSSSLRLVTYNNSVTPQNNLLETDYASIEIRVYN